METSSLTDRLAACLDIEDHWYDYKGERHVTSSATRSALVRAMGFVTNDPGRVEKQLNELELSAWYRVLPVVSVIRERRERGIPLAVRAEHAGYPIDWCIRTEDGMLLTGSVRPEDCEWLEEKIVEGVLHKRFDFRPPATLPLGYHRLELVSRSDNAVFAWCHLIVVPERCYQPEALAEGQRLWGISVQLYTLRSERNWGIGDFADLRELVLQAAELGADYIALNPLHALFPANPAHSSPYSPSSRAFLNTLYIDVPGVADFAECAQARALTERARFRRRLDELRNDPYVGYVGVAELKQSVLEMLYKSFCERHLATASARAAAFHDYCENGGEPLRRQAVFDALYETMWRDHAQAGWRHWPAQYHSPEGEAVAAFAAENDDRVRYFLYLQWVAAIQLDEAARAARRAGMRIGLYLDLAVGVDPSGAEAWSNQDVLSDSASVGAPPDPLALTGQDWGVPPLKPRELKEQGYKAFASLMRGNMKDAGALRIDHVMALCRLWWIPRGMPSSAGAYVHYPVDDLFGIVALESQRNRCVVIGEDLGTVPDAVRWKMSDYGLFAYKVLYFEKDSKGACVSPGAYPREALVAVSTHDLPPFRSFWTGSDLSLRERLGLFPSDEVRDASYSERMADRRALLAALVEAGEWPPSTEREPPPYSARLAEAVERYVAGSRAALMSVQLEDWLGMEDPVNVPGTSDEHRNWQRKLESGHVDLFSDPRVWDHAVNLNSRRNSQGALQAAKFRNVLEE
ncbi:MAG: 4-alpha-glucanotransferase [Chromatiales bacterium]|nr:4-alpha-glucanotransferase [Chromatiales bacterium]